MISFCCVVSRTSSSSTSCSSARSDGTSSKSGASSWTTEDRAARSQTFGRDAAATLQRMLPVLDQPSEIRGHRAREIAVVINHLVIDRRQIVIERRLREQDAVADE